MGETEIYDSIRNEILLNNVLMYLTTLFVVAALFVGIWVVQQRNSILSVFLPLLSLSWAGAIVRFDYLIHRQGAYLRAVEEQLRTNGISIPLWETWKGSLRSTAIVVPLADGITFLCIVLPTIFILFGPTQSFFSEKGWRAGKIYAWGLLAFMLLLLGSIPAVTSFAGQ